MNKIKKKYHFSEMISTHRGARETQGHDVYGIIQTLTPGLRIGGITLSEEAFDVPQYVNENGLHNCEKVDFDFAQLEAEINTVRPKLVIENVVATIHTTTQGLSLDYVTEKLQGTTYKPKKFPGVIHRMDDPKTTALIFKSGKMVITGAKSELDCKKAAQKRINMLNELFGDVQLKVFNIDNVVGKGVTTFPIKLAALAESNPFEFRYEPEVFPGVIYRKQGLNITMLVFASGKVVLTGGKTEEKVRAAFRIVLPILKKYQKRMYNGGGNSGNASGHSNEIARKCPKIAGKRIGIDGAESYKKRKRNHNQKQKCLSEK